VDKLVLRDTHANPDTQRGSLAPDIVYAPDKILDADAKTSLRWSFSLNSSLRKYPTHSATPCNHERKTFASRMILRFLIQIVANYVHIQRLTRGLSFASTPSPCLYVDDLLDSFVGIAAARLLPRASITSKNRISSRPFSGVTHISIRPSDDTTLPSHQHRRRISSRSSMSNTVCGKTILPIVNSV